MKKYIDRTKGKDDKEIKDHKLKTDQSKEKRKLSNSQAKSN